MKTISDVILNERKHTYMRNVEAEKTEIQRSGDLILKICTGLLFMHG